MEISKCVWQQPKVFGGARRRLSAGAIEYIDKGHLRYYCAAQCSLKMKNEKKKKKKKKQKQIVVVENDELKKMRKQAKRMMVQDDDSDSSSSSSSSSDSDGNCKTRTAIGDESAALALLRMPLLQEPRLSAPAEESPLPSSSSSSSSSSMAMAASSPSPSPSSSSSSSMAMAMAASSSSSSIGAGVTVAVCMGNKCKKMGAESLMAELQQSPETVALPCKCMGKCKSAPNVKLLRLGPDDDDTLFTNVNLTNISTILHHQLLLPA